jgi:phosphoglycerate dehydrogenase-like enzyme
MRPAKLLFPVSCLAVGLAVLISSPLLAEQNAGQTVAEMGLSESRVVLRELPGWRPPKKILIAVDGPTRLAWLQEVTKGTATLLVAAANYRELTERIIDADALIGPCTPGVIEAGASLKWVQAGEVGVENCVTIPSIQTGKVMLTNMRGVSASTVAEHTMSLILALCRQLPLFIDSQQGVNGGPNTTVNPIALQGKSVLVVGLGSNGREIAERAHAFRMHVIATNIETNIRPDFVDYLGGASELSTLVGKADFIVNSTPLTKETLGLFNRELFARMKRTAFFYNVGRGRTVVTDDLVNALKGGTIAGAGLDVIDPDPLPQGHPLRKMPNVIITPHIGDKSDLKVERSWLLIKENLRRYVVGGKLLSVVDVKKGY